MNFKCVLAVSGGMDSMVLLHSISKIIPRNKLIVAHFNHKTRGALSNRDEKFVKKISKKYQIKFISEKRKSKKTDENSLRLERKEFLIKVAKKNKTKVILTAHHAQDQLETILMRMLRGTSLEGFGGMKSLSGISGVYFYKPLLKYTRQDIEKYSRKNKLKYVDDLSNQQEIYFRNKIRKKLIPVFQELSKEFGGASRFYQNILNLTDDLKESKKFIDLKTHILFKNLCEVTQYWIKIPLKDFLGLSHFEQKQLTQHIYKVLNLQPLLREQLENLLLDISQKKNKTMPSQETLVTLSCGFLYFQTKEQQIKVLPKAPKGYRYIRPGDRLGSTKVKKILLEKKIPQPERRFILIAH